MDDVQVRPATPDDAARLAAVYRAAYAENRELGFPAKAESATESDVAAWIRDYRVLVAESETVVGGVRLEETDPDRLKFSRLAVHPARQGEGVGSRLLDSVERIARDGDWTVLWLTTPPEHPTLPAVYRGRGFEQTAPYPLEYRDYDEMVMEKSVG